MKKECLLILSMVLVLVISMSVFASVNVSSDKKIETLKDYRSAINSSCEWDSDCEIKDVGNCCGYSPECVNKNSFVNGTLVEELCKKEKEGSACGFVSINYCKCSNKRCKGFLSPETCPGIIAPNCLAELVDQGIDEKGCKKTPKCIKKLSNGKDSEIKVMPETASAKAIERLSELGFNVTLKEVGNGDNAKAFYFVSGEKDTKILGFINAKAKVSVEVDAVSGEVLRVNKPWWSFLAGI